ncbi:hypothetical protein HPB47_018254 [Ixodes persulcatus]|uniref:Uncharacterized protein n=1 Tax=Ixodes persulcatus TaxID=34615 RepID=A0AC60QN75_IXOPE|nr:hypothetical protein HPB47_018254 [Ixodes persulcatus]
MPSDIELRGSGTPQGSVLSPSLFNLSVNGLLEKLAAIEGMQHSVYADDVTIWMKGGSDGFIQEQLQEAINTVEDYLRPQGLACSPAKSEVLLIKRRKTSSDIELYSEGRKIPTVDSVRRLGQRTQTDGVNKEAINIIKEATYQTIRFISRVSNRHHGMEEENLIRLIKAFVISRIAYVTPFLRLNLSDKEKLNCLTRKLYKRALRLGDYTPNKKLEAVGLPNNIEEIIKAQRTSQLEKLGLLGNGKEGSKSKSPLQMLQGQEDFVYTDAELITTGKMVATVTDERGCIINSCSVKTKEPAVAEEVAIALTTGVKGVRIIVTDFTNTILRFTKRRVSRHALRVLRGSREDITTNTRLVIRAVVIPSESADFDGRSEKVVSYGEVLDYYVKSRKQYPPADTSLDRRASVRWRQLRTGTFLCPAQQRDSLLKSTGSTTQKKQVQVAADATRAEGPLAAV